MQFGTEGTVIYVGIAKKSLNSRDLLSHFNSKRTGSSTLRRSIGAILKSDLDLVAIPRSEAKKKIDIYNYRFNSDGEERLTEWMKNNLLVGYYVVNSDLEYKSLRILEEEMIKLLHPILDLDRRTRHLNPFECELDILRCICRKEALKN